MGSVRLGAPAATPAFTSVRLAPLPYLPLSGSCPLRPARSVLLVPRRLRPRWPSGLLVLSAGSGVVGWGLCLYRCSRHVAIHGVNLPKASVAALCQEEGAGEPVGVTGGGGGLSCLRLLGWQLVCVLGLFLAWKNSSAPMTSVFKVTGSCPACLFGPSGSHIPQLVLPHLCNSTVLCNYVII